MVLSNPVSWLSGVHPLSSFEIRIHFLFSHLQLIDTTPSLMAFLSTLGAEANPTNLSLVAVTAIILSLLSHIVYRQFFHPLSKFPGPWWATSFSLVGALISVSKREPQFFMYLVGKYGSMLPPLVVPLT